MTHEKPVINLLLLDDEPRVLNSLSRQLSDSSVADFIIQVATCPKEAQVILQKFHIEVIVTDYQMTSMNGLEFLEKACNNRSDLGMLLLTGEVADLKVAHKWADEIGVHRILSKPCDIDDLSREIIAAYEIANRVKPESVEAE